MKPQGSEPSLLALTYMAMEIQVPEQEITRRENELDATVRRGREGAAVGAGAVVSPKRWPWLERVVAWKGSDSTPDTTASGDS
jgi:hypothetical protein